MKTQSRKGNKMKNTKIIIATCVLIAAAAIISFANRTTTPPRTISVTGECLTSVPKDRVAITLRVTTLNKSAAESMKLATTKIAKITEYLKTQDVKMQTTQFDSYEKTEWNRNTQKSVSLGVETNIAVEVSADNIEKIESILSQFAGQSDVYSENLRMFTSSEAMQPVLENCLGTAVENARARANALAAGDNRRAGKMLDVSYGANASDTYRPTSNFMARSAKMAVMETAMDGAVATGGIVAKDTEVSVTVNATFEIK